MLVKIIGIVLFSLVGAFDIWQAIDSFQRGRYFLFSWCLMMAVWMAAGVFKCVLLY